MTKGWKATNIAGSHLKDQIYHKEEMRSQFEIIMHTSQIWQLSVRALENFVRQKSTHFNDQEHLTAIYSS